MILRRVIEHVKTQNWTAVALDFVIVVVGVFIGIQVSNWNAARADQEVFDRQLIAVRVEMNDNLDRFTNSRARAEQQFEDIAQLREILADQSIDAETSRIDNLLWQSVRVMGIYPKRNALDVVLASDYLSLPKHKEIADAFEQWDGTLAELRREQSDELNFRDGFQNPYFSTQLSSAAIFRQSDETLSLIAPPRFGNSREVLANDPVLENILVARQLTAKQDINNVTGLIDVTETIIRLVDGRKEN
ncbi:hypothetical protein [Hyphococcus sp.]|uniref:hypothetical protein n=1 Tax=Hyphococcus sp. TaxID=2038636 RepID=UPI003CCBD165